MELSMDAPLQPLEFKVAKESTCIRKIEACGSRLFVIKVSSFYSSPATIQRRMIPS